MLLYVMVPLLAQLRIAWAASEPERAEGWRRWRQQHLWISVIYSVTNLAHLVADIVVPDSRSDQVALMAVMLALGLMINREAWTWWHQAQAPIQRSDAS